MSQPFPLYDQLRKEATSNPQVTDLRRTSSTINSFSTALDPQSMDYHYKIIQALIYHHALVEGLPRNIKGLSFESRMFNGGGVKYDMRHLPATLQHILNLYVTLVTTPAPANATLRS